MSQIDDAVSAADKIHGWMSQIELRWLASAASSRKLVVEIGSWQGRSAKAMAMTVGEKLFCIDPWYRATGANLKDLHPELPDAPDNVILAFKKHLEPELAAGKVVPMRMKAAEAVDPIRTILNGRKLDMVFIDGGHKYEEVSADIKDWRPMIASGGILCGHDWNHQGWPGVVKAVMEFVPGYEVVTGTSIWRVTV
jgi:cephalosporin hydroxylase